MSNPSHAYIERKQDEFVVHLGVAKEIYEAVENTDRPTNMFEAMFFNPHKLIPFAHPSIPHPMSFIPHGKPISYKIGEQNEGKLRNRLKHLTKKSHKSIKFVPNPESIYCNEEMIAHYVPMGHNINAPQNTGLYTKNLGPCFGIAIYNSNNKNTSLLHSNGCGEELTEQITRSIDNMLESPEFRNGTLEVNIANGLLTMGDDEVYGYIMQTRDDLLEYFFGKNIDPTVHFTKERGEVINFFMIKPDKTVDVIKGFSMLEY